MEKGSDAESKAGVDWSRASLVWAVEMPRPALTGASTRFTLACTLLLTSSRDTSKLGGSYTWSIAPRAY